jgi:hypothetical protein
MSPPTTGPKFSLRARVREFRCPPLNDVLVLGKNAPLGCAAVRKAIQLVVAVPYEHVEVEDDVISDILVRSPILQRLPKPSLIAFVCQHIKPLMRLDEILDLTLDLETIVEVNGP